MLRMHCRRLGKMDFYALFHEVYGFDLTAAQARGLLASCRAEVNDIVSGFGPAAADFFYHAVDGEFRWGQTKGILTVYRLYVPWSLRRFKKQDDVFDDTAWREAHSDLCRFVGLDRPDAARTPSCWRGRSHFGRAWVRDECSAMLDSTSYPGSPAAWRRLVSDDIGAVSALAAACLRVDGGLLFAADEGFVQPRFLPAAPGTKLGAFDPAGD